MRDGFDAKYQREAYIIRLETYEINAKVDVPLSAIREHIGH